MLITDLFAYAENLSNEENEIDENRVQIWKAKENNTFTLRIVITCNTY